MRIARAFLNTWFAAATALGACVFAFTLAVDPYRMLDLVTIESFNASRPKAVNQTSIAKAYGVARAKADVVLVGNSRVDVGFAAEDPLWARLGAGAYNLGLPGTGIVEQARHLHHANAAHRVRVALVGVDFIDFLFDPGARAPKGAGDDRIDLRLLVDREGRPNANRWRGVVADAIGALFSLDATWDALRTVAGQGPHAADITPRGSNPMRDYDELIAREGHRTLFDQRNLENLKLRLGPRREIRRPDGTPSPAFALVEEMIAPLRAGGTRIILFTHPYHAQVLETFRLAGLWERFEQWKSDLVAFVDAANAAGPAGARIELWDFADYDATTTEAVPAAGDRRTRMRWYWEGGHYKRELGAAMARRILEPDGDGPGVRLTAGALAGHLAETGARGAAYRRDFAADVERLTALRDSLIRRAP